MELFDSHRKKFLRRFSLLLPLCFLILISSIFSSVSALHPMKPFTKNNRHWNRHLKMCYPSYAMNGQYPESLDQILNDYHITYDRSRFVVEYTQTVPTYFLI